MPLMYFLCWLACLALLKTLVDQMLIISDKEEFYTKDSALIKAFRVPLASGVTSCLKQISVWPAEQLFYQHLHYSCNSPSLHFASLLANEVTPVLEVAERSIATDFSWFPSRHLIFVLVTEAGIWFQIQALKGYIVLHMLSIVQIHLWGS